jgi:hypothetical protein
LIAIVQIAEDFQQIAGAGPGLYIQPFGFSCVSTFIRDSDDKRSRSAQP